MFQRLNDMKKNASTSSSAASMSHSKPSGSVANPFDEVEDTIAASSQAVGVAPAVPVAAPASTTQPQQQVSAQQPNNVVTFQQASSFKATSPERKQVLQKMIKEKREANREKSEAAPKAASTNEEKLKLQKMIEDRRRQKKESQAPPQPPTASHGSSNVTSSIVMPPPPPSDASKQRAKVSRSQRARRPSTPQHTKANTATTTTTGTKAKAQNEKESELTFRPKIRPLPAGIYGGSTPNGSNRAGNVSSMSQLSHLSFAERTARTVMEREARLHDKRAQKVCLRALAATMELDGGGSNIVFFSCGVLYFIAVAHGCSLSLLCVQTIAIFRRKASSTDAPSTLPST